MSTIREALTKHKRLIIDAVIVLMLIYSSVILIMCKYAYAAVVLLPIALLGLLNVKLKGKHEVFKDIYTFILIFIETIYLFQLITVIDIADDNELVYLVILLKDGVFLYLLPLLLSLYLLVRAFAGQRAAAVIVPIPYALICLTDFYLLRFRGHGFNFADILNIKTAANVAINYTFDPLIPLALILVPYVMTLICVFDLEKSEKRRRVYTRVVLGLCAALAFSISFRAVSYYASCHKLELWGYNGSVFNGFYMNFEMSILSSIITPPAGYSTDAIDVAAADVTAELPEDPPVIIVVMSESYTDISVYEDLIGPVEDPAPYWNSLSENTIHGYALSSVFAGNTANSEFEFLTSLTMEFLPNGSVVYSQYLDHEIPSLPRFLSDLGYHTTAMHPFLSNGWNRTTVYPLLSFDDMLFAEDFDFDDSDLVRDYVSDRCAYRNVVELINNSNEPEFYFLITMQNHGGYHGTYSNFTPREYIRDSAEDTDVINTFLSLINISDQALESLISDLQDCDRNCVLLMFGDHQPGTKYLPKDFNPGGVSYVVPYIIWANYDIDQETVNELTHTEDPTSINYLALDLLRVAGISYDPYYDLIDRIREDIPSINVSGYRLRGEDDYHYASEEPDTNMMQLYRYLEYDVLFDRNDSSTTSLG